MIIQHVQKRQISLLVEKKHNTCQCVVEECVPLNFASFVCVLVFHRNAANSDAINTFFGKS